MLTQVLAHFFCPDNFLQFFLSISWLLLLTWGQTAACWDNSTAVKLSDLCTCQLSAMGPALWLWWAERDRQSCYEGKPSLPVNLSTHKGYCCTGKQVFLDFCLDRFFQRFICYFLPESRTMTFHLEAHSFVFGVEVLINWLLLVLYFIPEAIKMVYCFTALDTQTY